MFAFYRAFVGPVARQLNSPYFYNWSGINLDGSLSPTGTYTLGASMLGAPSTIAVGGGGALPAAGGVWVGPNGVNEKWEYVGYSSNSGGTLGGLLRTVDPEINTTHTVGAPVHFWFPVGINSVQFDGQMDEKQATSYWTASLDGTYMPRGAIRNNHLCVVQYRTTPVAAWRNYLLGWLANPDVSDDSGFAAEWSAKLFCSADLAAMTEIDRVRVGDRNVARDSSASALSELASPYKERYSGDYTASDPDLSASSARDGETGTPWIAEHIVGLPLGDDKNADATQPGNVIITQAHISKAAGEPNGYRWIELTVTQNSSQPNFLLISGGGAVQGIGMAGDYETGDQIIVCEDDVLFQRQNPLAEPTKLIDIDDSTFFNALNPAGDSIGLWFDIDVNEGWKSLIKWGTGALNPFAGSDKPNPPNWSGANAPAPLLGRTLRYIWANSTTPANNWVADYSDHAGYRYSVHPVDDGVWIGIELPGIGLKLKADINANYTGVITLEDDSGSTTGGLDVSGIGQIGDEQVAYNNRTNTTITITGRAYGGTVAASHVAGDRFLVVDGGFATDAPPINKVAWRRRPGATNYPVSFVFKRSALQNPRDPGDSNYNADYEDFVVVTDNFNPEYVRPLTNTRRMKKLLLFIKYMLVNPSRPRIDELEAYLDPAYYDDGWLTNGQPVANIIMQLLMEAEIPNSAIFAENDGLHNINDFDTEKGRAWRIVADLADYAGYRIMVAPDSKITCTVNNFWTTATPTPSKIWNRVNARQARALLSNDGANNVRQISLEWETASKSAKGTEVFPASTDWRGSVVDLGPRIFANATQAQAAARKHYYMARLPYTYVVEAAVGDPTIMPGQIHRLDWQFGHDTHGMMSRTCIVQSVSHRFADHAVETTVSLLQLDREVAN